MIQCLVYYRVAKLAEHGLVMGKGFRGPGAHPYKDMNVVNLLDWRPLVACVDLHLKYLHQWIPNST